MQTQPGIAALLQGPPASRDTLAVTDSSQDDLHDRRRRKLQAILDGQFEGNKSALARALSIGKRVSYSYVWRLLKPDTASRKNMGEDLARRFERALRLDPGYFDQEEGQAQGLLESRQARPEVAQSTPRPYGPRAVPVLDITTLDLRMPGTPQGTVRTFVYTDRDHGPATYAVDVNTDAMEPDVHPGDKVLIDPTVRHQPGDIVLAVTDSQQVVLRRYRPTDDAGSKWELAAANQSYAPIRGEDCRIVGVMVERHEYRRPR